MSGIEMAYHLMGIQDELRARDTARATQKYPYLGQAHPFSGLTPQEVYKLGKKAKVNIVSEIERDYNKMMEGWDK